MKNTEQIENELQALRNAIDSYRLIGFTIHQDYSTDRRIKRGSYFLRDKDGNSITGFLDYTQLNHFIRGYGMAYKKYGPYMESVYKWDSHLPTEIKVDYKGEKPIIDTH